jgi:hypothetical protein
MVRWLAWQPPFAAQIQGVKALHRKMDIAAEVRTRGRKYGGLNPQQQKCLLSYLDKIPSNEVVPALFSVFAPTEDENSEQAFQEQQLAGYLLLFGRHSCPIPLRGALLMLLDGWNVSIEGVPWYLTREYGQEVVLNCIADLLKSQVSEQHRRILQTLDFWVRSYRPKPQQL